IAHTNDMDDQRKMSHHEHHDGVLSTMGHKLHQIKDKVTHVFSSDDEHDPHFELPENQNLDLGQPMNHKGLIKKMMVREMEQVAHKASMFRRASCPEPQLLDTQNWRSITSSHKQQKPPGATNPPIPANKQRKSVTGTPSAKT
ncbi:unnamed protein product, partial [Mesorhabditis spiculigera]